MARVLVLEGLAETCCWRAAPAVAQARAIPAFAWAVPQALVVTSRSEQDVLHLVAAVPLLCVVVPAAELVVSYV